MTLDFVGTNFCPENFVLEAKPRIISKFLRQTFWLSGIVRVVVMNHTKNKKQEVLVVCCKQKSLVAMSWNRPSATGTSPPARCAHSTVVCGSGKIVVFGGWNGSRMLNDLFILYLGIKICQNFDCGRSNDME